MSRKLKPIKIASTSGSWQFESAFSRSSGSWEVFLYTTAARQAAEPLGENASADVGKKGKKRKGDELGTDVWSLPLLAGQQEFFFPSRKQKIRQANKQWELTRRQTLDSVGLFKRQFLEKKGPLSDSFGTPRNSKKVRAILVFEKLSWLLEAAFFW